MVIMASSIAYGHVYMKTMTTAVAVVVESPKMAATLQLVG